MEARGFGECPARTRRVAAGLLLALGVLASGARHAAAQTTHATLDWTAKHRWIHVDNMAAGQVGVFEAARHGWLAALRRGDGLLADGRPLFWEHRGADGSTFYTFYPFERFGELDDRRETVLATQRSVGREALERYDAADSVLAPPHYSQIWRRDGDLDYVPAGADSLTERTAACGRMEFQTPDFHHGDEGDALWREIFGRLDEVLPTTQSLSVRRRADMSNPGS